MREVLFKAKRISDRDWVFGYYVKLFGKHWKGKGLRLVFQKGKIGLYLC